MKYLFSILFPALVLLGCTPLANAPVDPAVGNSLAKVEVHVTNAAKNVDDAKPHTDSTGKVKLDAASDDLTKALSELATTKDAEKKAEDAYNKLSQDDAKVKDELAAEKDHWIGAKTRNLFKILTTVAVLLVVLQIALGAFGLSGATGLHTVFAYASRGLGLVVPWVGAAINWGLDHLWLKKQTVVKP